MSRIAFIVCPAAVLMLAAPAVAASADYLLEIDGVEGAAPASAKISSWSFGASNPVPIRSGAAGKSTKPNLGSSGQDGVTQQESHSSSADARKNGELQAADFKRLAALDEVDGLSLTLPADSDAAHQLCGNTDHLRSGRIVEPDGTIYDLSSIKAVCARGNAGAVAVQITGSMKQKNYTGHVTLMK